MTKKPDSKWLSLATASILEQPWRAAKFDGSQALWITNVAKNYFSYAHKIPLLK